MANLWQLLHPEIPAVIKCPISGNLMCNPVTAECGHSFGSEAFDRLMAITNVPKCPMCKARVNIDKLQYNETIADRAMNYQLTHPELNPLADDLALLEFTGLPAIQVQISEVAPVNSGLKTVVPKITHRVVPQPIGPIGILSSVGAFINTLVTGIGQAVANLVGGIFSCFSALFCNTTGIVLPKMPIVEEVIEPVMTTPTSPAITAPTRVLNPRPLPMLFSAFQQMADLANLVREPRRIATGHTPDHMRAKL